MGCINAQIIPIPDANFKTKLLQANPNNFTAYDALGNAIKVDINNNNQIEVSEALLVHALYINNSNIVSIQGINSFLNLKLLSCYFNNISVININGLTNLIIFECMDNQLTQLTLTNLPSLTKVNCTGNLLTTLDFNGLPALETAGCGSNLFTSLDFSNYPVFSSLGCSNNPNLTSINLKNGFPLDLSPFGSYDYFNNCPNLTFICVDENEKDELIQSFSVFNPNASNFQVNSYCSFNPGGIYYTTQGNSRYDYNNNGCDASDNFYPNLKLNILDGTNSDVVVANASGNYNLSMQAGTFTINPILENPSYFTISPASTTVNFPATTSPFIQNFCISPNGIHNDLEVQIISGQAISGFNSYYKIIYRNKGTQQQSGVLNFNFDDSLMDYVSSTIPYNALNTGEIIWNFSNLQPFETREIILFLDLNSIMDTPPLVSGDILQFSATVTGTTDETPTDNIFQINQPVVNSYDPNHKTCLEGNSLSTSMIGKEIHYKVEFENNGTATAQNIVVKDMIDTTKYDISSILPIQSSHPFITKITPEGKVEFIFEGINLPFDNANNDGFVAFKIKTKATLNAGDSVSNMAQIYFDYNFPIVTNNEVSTFTALGTNNFVDKEKTVNIYPNPVTNQFSIYSKAGVTIKSLSIYNNLGQLVQTIINPNQNINIENLTSGIYFIKVKTDSNELTTKFIKN